MFLTSLNEARSQIEQTQNPLILYDNDADGLCSYLLIQRWIGRGEGVPVRSYPDLTEQYLNKIDELKADSVIVLDIHSISEKFIEGVKERGLQIIWIDHHESKEIEKQNESNMIFYFNPLYTLKKGKNNNPVSLLCYEIANRKEDDWISLLGCVSDCYLPKFAKETASKHSELWSNKTRTAFDVYYNTEFGKIVLMLNFALKDMPSKVEAMQRFLIGCKSPEEIISDEQNPIMSGRAKSIYKKYVELVEDAENAKEGNSFLYVYSGDTSMSSEISNVLIYRHPNSYIAVAFRKQGIVNISLRGKNVKKVLDTILKEIPNSTGGGHADAVGARIPADKLEEFEKLFKAETARFK